MSERIENHPVVLLMLQTLASYAPAVAPAAAAEFAQRAIDLIEALLRERAAMQEALSYGLAEVHAAHAACPIGRDHSPHYAPCPKCGARPDQNCGPTVAAEARLVGVVERLLDDTAKGGCKDEGSEN